jgi:hypothetical protein
VKGIGSSVSRFIAGARGLKPAQRAGLAIIFALACANSGFGAADRAARAQEAAQQTAAQARAAATLTQQVSDTENQRRAENAARKVRAWSVNASTYELAQLQAEAAFRDILKATGLQDTRLTRAPRKPEKGALQRIVFDVVGAYEEAAFMDLLRTAARASVSYRIVSLDIDENDKHPRFRMRIEALYAKPEGNT